MVDNVRHAHTTMGHEGLLRRNNGDRVSVSTAKRIKSVQSMVGASAAPPQPSSARKRFSRVSQTHATATYLGTSRASRSTLPPPLTADVASARDAQRAELAVEDNLPDAAERVEADEARPLFDALYGHGLGVKSAAEVVAPDDVQRADTSTDFAGVATPAAKNDLLGTEATPALVQRQRWKRFVGLGHKGMLRRRKVLTHQLRVNCG
jgi:hypothetical protein